jgi:DNA topoisomerase-1
MPSSRLFTYVDSEGALRPITPKDVNGYIKEATATEFSAKDFRTWGGTLLAAIELAERGLVSGERSTKRMFSQVVKRVAERLGNTPSVCRDCYIHPAVFERYRQGVTLENVRKRRDRAIKRQMQDRLEPEELALLQLLSSGPVA